MAIRIVTDSTADLPRQLAKEYGIAIVPLNVHFGEEILKDGVEILGEEFYHRLKQESLLPNTSQPSPGEFIKVYQKIAAPGDTIISLHISGAMSGTSDTAKLAASMMGDGYSIQVIDTRTVSMGLGLLALRAGRMAEAGMTLEFILASIAGWQEELLIYFTVNSLDYLQRTGRIGKATAFVGSVLNIKPLLSVVDGVIVPVERIRGSFPKVAEQMVANLASHFGKKRLTISIIHSELSEAAQTLKELAVRDLVMGEYYQSIIGPVVGSHAGPQTIGIIALPEE